jgi:polysaccharide export outer membrane protein
MVGITVASHPEYSGTYGIAEDGTIDYPLLAGEYVVGISTAELRREITFQLAKHLENPLVSVRIKENPDITVVMLGQVAQPGPVTTYKGATVQEAIAAAGGGTDKADYTRIKLVRGDSTMHTRFFNMKEFMKQGSMEHMPTLRNNDRVILLSKGRSAKVKVIGAVEKPGFFELEEPLTIFEVIYMAGGPTKKADLSRVRRLSKQQEQEEEHTAEEIIDVRRYIDRGNMEEMPTVTRGDVIIVYSKWFDWNTMLSVMNNALLFIVTVQNLSGVFK